MTFRYFPFFLMAIGGTAGALLSFGYYLEIVKDLSPCLLCILQRYCYCGLIFFAATGLALKRFRTCRLITALLLTVISSLGLVLASRQVWLQRFSNQEALECLPSFDFLIQTLPWSQIIYKIYLGSSDCAEINWLFLGGSIAEWSTFCFLILLFACASLSFNLRRS